MRKTIYLTNLERCAPKSAISAKNTRGCWRAVTYQAEGVSGVLLVASPETNAPAVSLHPGVDGWHAVYLGLWPQLSPAEGPSAITVKLSGDVGSVTVMGQKESEYAIEEVFWKYADLTGKDIVFGQSPSGFRSGIAYVKLVSLAPAEVEAFKSDRGRSDTRRLIATVDNHGIYYSHRHSGVEDIYRALEHFRDTDFGRVIWNNGGSADVSSFPTKVGAVYGRNCDCFPRDGDRMIAENMRMYLDKGIDTMAVARDYARSLGLEFHCSIRMGAFQFHPPYDEVFTSPFYLKHPELRCRDYNDLPVSRLSYAFPEAQDYVLSLFAELAEYKPDGLSLIFLRADPFLLYEEPLLASFRALTGKDARALPENDISFQKHRCNVMTGFVRRVRSLCRKNGMALSAFVFNDEPNNIIAGLDPAAWIEESLVDFLIPYPRTAGEGRKSLDGIDLKPIDFSYFTRIAGGSGCGLYPEISRGAARFDDGSPAAYRRQALAAYAAGVDGLSFWDGGGMNAPRSWSMIRRLGHKDELVRFDDGEGSLYRSVPLADVGGYRMDKHPPHWAY